MTFQDFKSKYQKAPVEEYPNSVTDSPVVSVCVMTYQHKDYIRECLDGILMQKTDFPFEILLGEDASTDGTREICIEYAERHPDIIRLFLHDRANNIHINGSPTGRFNFIYSLYCTKGKYIALCDGDDFWTDDRKLAMQFKVLENHKDIILCNHKISSNDPSRAEVISRKNTVYSSNKFRLSFFLKHRNVKTLSAFFHKPPHFREDIMELLAPQNEKPFAGDYPLFTYLLARGNGYTIGKEMGEYRTNPQSATFVRQRGSIKERFNPIKWALAEKLKPHRYLRFRIECLKYRYFHRLPYFLYNI